MNTYKPVVFYFISHLKSQEEMNIRNILREEKGAGMSLANIHENFLQVLSIQD